MKLAVLKCAENPYQLALKIDGQFLEIPTLPTLTSAMHLSLADLRTLCEGDLGAPITGELVAPVASEIEVWGAGVTYLRSRDARKEESDVPDVYQRVYEADRPELFFKGSAKRTRGSGANIGIRFDSATSIPEPEIAIYVNKFKEIIGYSICNDVTSRAIEGENPLYLSQAKIYVGSAALGPDVTPAWLAPVPKEMVIRARIIRGGSDIWNAETSLGSLNRKLEDLVDYAFRCQYFPDGLILSTGTGIVPPLEISLQEGDQVEISVVGLGVLSNKVVVIPDSPDESF